MGKASEGLKHALDRYGISRNQLAVAMGVNRSTVSHWYAGSRDPMAESIPQIVTALETLHPEAGHEFLRIYLGRSLDSLMPDAADQAEAKQMAGALQVGRSAVGRWLETTNDPKARAVLGLIEALQELDPIAAIAFIESYLGRSLVERDRGS
ncbi:MAG: hypothetical protein Fur0042_20740 [Cyanophyceae cyanobacterium]